jgi:hypothetical protein
MLICPNQNTPEYKSWEKAGISKEEIYAEYVLNNYALPMYSQDINKALTIPEIKSFIAQYSSLSKLGVSNIDTLQHQNVNAVGAYFKDVLYFSEKANQKTISEETGHAMLQKFADPTTYKLIMKVGKQLLETRLKAEGRTLQQYLKAIQTELGVSESRAEEYAQEEEFMKDYALYDSTGTQAQDLRKINQLTERLSFLGPMANKVAKIWVNLIKGLKQLFGKPDEITHALELIRSLKQNSQAKYHRGYNVPSFMYIPKGEGSVGVSAFAIQKIANDVAATYFNRYKDGADNITRVERLEEIFEDFGQYYRAELNEKPGDTELINLLFASTALDYDNDTKDDIGNRKLSTREEMLKNVQTAIKGLGVEILDDILDDSEIDVTESEVGGRQGWDLDPNQRTIESLSLGLKNIILRVGEQISIGDGKTLTFSPDVSHIYSGLIRYSSKAYNTTDRFKRMVEFSDFTGNKSSKLLIQDYFLKQFESRATYDKTDKNDGKLTVRQWVDLIKSKEFEFSKVSVNDSILAQEAITLIKGLELVSRDMQTMKITFGKEVTEFLSFDTNSNGLAKKLEAEYTDKLTALVNKFKRSNQEFNGFFEKNRKTDEDKDFLISILNDAGIYLNPKVKEVISDDTTFSKDTLLSDIRFHLMEAVKKDKPLLQSAVNIKDAGPLNTLISKVIAIQIEYDETILENAFTNMDGKTIYAFQRQTPIILTLRNLANKDFLDKFENGSPYIGQNNMWSNPGFIDNPIIKAFIALGKKRQGEKEQKIAAQTFSLDGLFSEEVEQGDFRDQVSFSDMDDRHFAASAINLMVQSTNQLEKKLDGKLFTAVTLGQNEASSLIDFNNVPVFRGDEIKDGIKRLVKQEVDRIRLIKSEIETFIAKKTEIQKNNIKEFLADKPVDPETNEKILTDEEQIILAELRKDLIDPKEGANITVTYDELKDYYRTQENPEPVYKGMLDGNYVMGVDGKINVKNTSELFKRSSFQVTKNLKDIIELENILTDINSEKGDVSDATISLAEVNLNNVLEEQLKAMKDMGVVELLDKSITNHKELTAEQIEKNVKQSAASRAFKFTVNADTNIKNLLRQFWLGSTFTNQILVGDPSLSFKNNLKDILKRHRPYNAALLGVDIPFSVPSLNIFPKSEVRVILSESDTDTVFDNQGIDKDDAQSYSSLDFWLYKKFSKGALTESSYNVYLKVQAGIKPTHKEVSESGAYFASDKTVSAQGDQVIKHSEHHITPYDVAVVEKATLLEAQSNGYRMNPDSRKLEAIKDQNRDSIFVGMIAEDGTPIINKLIPKENMIERFNLFAMLQGYSYNGNWDYSGPIDIKTPTTAVKGAQKNVLSKTNTLEEFSKNPEYYTQSIAANTYGDQVENSQGKKHVIDASQNQEIKINEIEKAQELIEEYLENHAQRNDFEIDLVMKELYGAEYNAEAKLDAKQFLDALTSLLKESGTDNQKLDFFSYKQVGEQFVANYNLNLPPIRQKFTQSLFKMFTRALRHKVAGNSLVQVSPSDYKLIKRFKIVKDVTVTMPDGTKEKRDIPTWDVVTYEQFVADSSKKTVDITNKETNKVYKYSGKNFVENKTDELTEALLKEQEAAPDNTIYFFDEVKFMKPYINESNELEFFVSEAVMPTWFDSVEDIPEALRLQYGVRIPSQDKQTSVAIEWVSAFGPERGNSIIVPKEIIYISGSDFDIDKLFTQWAEGYFEKGKFKLYENNINDFKRYMFKEKKFFRDALKEKLGENQTYKKLERELKSLFADPENKLLFDRYKEDERETVTNSNQNYNAQVVELTDIINGTLRNKADNARDALKLLREARKLESEVRNIEKQIKTELNFNEDVYELQILKTELLSEIDFTYQALQERYSRLGISESFENNRQIIENNKILLKQNKDFIDSQLPGIFEKSQEKSKIIEKTKTDLLAKYNYPTTAEEYKGKTYPAIINNRQLKISQKLLSEPEIIYGEQGNIYETPATVQPYKDIFNKFIITVPKDSKEAKKYSKRDYFSKEEGGNINFYPFKDKNGNSIFTKDKDYVQTFSLLNFSMYQKAIQAAKAGIGLLANANVLGIFGKRLKMRLKKPIEFEGKEIYEFQFKTQKDRRVFDAISSTISVTTDEAKESQLSDHGISSMDLKVMAILLLHGLDIEDAYAFTRSKGAKDYNNLLAREKIARTPNTIEGKEAKFATNEARIAKYLPEITPEDYNIKREEFLEIKNDVIRKKYYNLYNDILGMYGELSKLIPAVKLKTGLAIDVPGFIKALNDIRNADNFVDTFQYYTIGNKSKDFLNSIKVYNTVESVVSKELVEMNPLFRVIQNLLESSISSRKSDYDKNILKYIDQFLLGTYARELTETQGLFANKETFKNDLIKSLEDLYAQELPESDPLHKALKASKDHLRAIVRLQKGELRLNFEGKLNQKLKDLVADSWLLLKNSPVEEVRTVADGLFKYYFLKDALQYKPGSLELAFPASKFKDISKVYDSIIKSKDVNLVYEFITYFGHLEDTVKHLKNYKTEHEAFGLEQKKYEEIRKYVYEKVVTSDGQSLNNLIGIQINPEVKNLKNLVRIGNNVYVLADNNVYYKTNGIVKDDFNILLTGSKSISDFHRKIKNKITLDGPFEGSVESSNTPEFNSLPSKSSIPTMTYAGIGSRETPQEVLDLMTEAAKYLDGLGYTLRSGGAAGADTAFEKGAIKKEIFKGFDPVGETEIKIAHEIHPDLKGAMSASKNKKIKAKIAEGASNNEAEKSGERSAWAVQNLMARNTNQIFGKNLDSTTDFVLFYAQETNNPLRPKGGTGQAVEMARRKGIPTINMASPDWRKQLTAVVNSNKPASVVEDIYSKLGNKTQSENVVLPKDLGLKYVPKPNNFWSEIEPAFRKEYPNGLVAFRGKNTDFNIGNPFNWQSHGVGKATNMFIDWILTGNNYNEVEVTETLRQDYLSKIKKSKGEKILYYSETGTPTHATALDYLINKYNWSDPASVDRSTETGNKNQNNFQGYKGGFEDKGKGTPEGDGKDKAMRQVADGFIGEIVNNGKESSSLTSAYEIAKKLNNKIDKEFLRFTAFSSNNGTLDENSINAKVIMLARNGAKSGKPLSQNTKEAIKDAKTMGAQFVVGDYKGVDSQFIDYLQEIGAKFTIYHTGNKPRIVVNQPVSTETSNTKSTVPSNEFSFKDITADDIVKYLNSRMEKTYLNQSGLTGLDKIIFRFNDREDSFAFISEKIIKESEGYRIITGRYNVLVDFNLSNIIQTVSLKTGSSFRDKSGSNGSIEIVNDSYIKDILAKEKNLKQSQDNAKNNLAETNNVQGTQSGETRDKLYFDIYSTITGNTFNTKYFAYHRNLNYNIDSEKAFYKKFESDTLENLEKEINSYIDALVNKAGKTQSSKVGSRKSLLESLIKKEDNLPVAKGAVVQYKDSKWILWNVNSSGKAQLIDVEGKKAPGTPNINNIKVLSYYPTTVYNGVDYIVTPNENIYSLATGDKVYTALDNSTKTQKERIIKQLLEENGLTPSPDAKSIDELFDKPCDGGASI